MPDDPSLFLDTTDYRGKRVIFTVKKWKIKSRTHSYLLLPQFKFFIAMALEKPTEVWEDYDDPNKKHCYYYKYSATSYIKVVVWIDEDPCQVVTAYNLDYIKEMNYPSLRRVI
jgi:hypothetical protein